MSREVGESEILRKAVESLSSKVKGLKEKDNAGPNVIALGTMQIEEKAYNTGNNYESIGSIRLSKGKYLLTLSFLLKASNQWIYIYFNQGQQVIQNHGFYVPNNSMFMPHMIRKVHNVVNNEEAINFNTYYAQSYPVVLKNVVVTAQKIPE